MQHSFKKASRFEEPHSNSNDQVHKSDIDVIVNVNADPIEVPDPFFYVVGSLPTSEADGVSDIAMYFNGCVLAVTLKGTLNGKSWERTNTFKAVSGKANQPDPSRKNGPLPDGQYSFNINSIQYRFERNWLGNYSYPDWAANNPIREVGSNEADAYGDYRVPLTIRSFDVQLKDPRSGFYLHGSQNGNGFGSAGCIDVGTATVCNGVIGGLYNYYDETRQSLIVQLRVKKTCDPYKK